MSDLTLLDLVLAPHALRVLFQPVLKARDGAMVPHYYEGLVRGPEGTSVESPDVLFEYARRKGALAEVDRACVRAVLDEAAQLPAGASIGINVHASTLALDPEFLNVLGDLASARSIDPLRIVVEVVEHAPPWDVAGFRNGIRGLRDIGVRVALDDIGLGHSNYLMVLECRPEYFKVDRYFVRGVRHDYFRQAVLSSVAQLARPFSAQVVAEGVESTADLEAVRATGIDLVQGWLFADARPAATFTDSPLTPE